MLSASNVCLARALYFAPSYTLVESNWLIFYSYMPSLALIANWRASFSAFNFSYSLFSFSLATLTFSGESEGIADLTLAFWVDYGGLSTFSSSRLSTFWTISDTEAAKDSFFFFSSYASLSVIGSVWTLETVALSKSSDFVFSCSGVASTLSLIESFLIEATTTIIWGVAGWRSPLGYLGFASDRIYYEGLFSWALGSTGGSSLTIGLIFYG